MKRIAGWIASAAMALSMSVGPVSPASAESAFAWTPAADDELAFDVYRDGKRFGSHVVRFARDGDRLRVDSDIELKVKFGPITAFHYVHEADEVWEGGELQSIEARTKRDGRWAEVNVRGVSGGLQTVGPAFEGVHPAGLVPSTHWNIEEMRGTAMLSTETGARLPIEVEDLGVERVRVGDGFVEATHYRVTSDLIVSFWYDAEGRWVKCAFEARGSDVEYVLRALPG